MENDPLNTYQPYIVCPYCGHLHTDTWEFDIDEDRREDIECESCEREFECEKHVRISYSTFEK